LILEFQSTQLAITATQPCEDLEEDLLLTRCPHCTASFRVFDDQLRAAHGKVRCGACMKVFKASEHLLADNQPGNQADQPQSADGLDDDKDFKELTTAVLDSSRGFNGSATSLSSEAKQDPLESTVVLRGGLPGRDDREEFSDTFKQLSEGHRAPASPPHSAFSSLENPGNSGGEQARSTQMPGGNSAGNRARQDDFREPLSAADQKPAREPSFQLDSLRADPVGSKPKLRVEPSRQWLKTLIWSLIATVIAGFIVAQLAWFQFDSLSRNSYLRPVYQQACQLFACELPSMFDIRQIRSQNLVVRSHPLEPKALIIDAVMINQASYEQPFPDIALTFSDINNQVIAKKTYTPGEYLSGESENFSKMPANAPISIALEILDPGKQAVNYAMGFVPNKAYKDAE